MADPVTPQPGLAFSIVNGGKSVIVVPGGPNGGYITNPISAVDQGFNQDTAPEVLYVDPTGIPATTQANDTCFALQPGEAWFIIPGQTTTTSVNAVTSGHKFSVVFF
jgi:hypothetical protein